MILGITTQLDLKGSRRSMTSQLEQKSFIEARDLSMIYKLGTREVQALVDLNLAIPKGQFVCVRGRSGSGKSTFLHCLAGLRQPTSGSVRVDDVNVQELSAREAALYRRRVVGIIFQFFNLLPMLTVAQNVMFPLALDGVSSREIDEKISALLEELGILDRRDHYPDQLSGGEMQRVAIARALVTDAEVILADEPTGNLDSETGDQIWKLLRDLTGKHCVTTVMVTHDVDATSYADRVVVLENGRLIEDTKPS